MAPTIHFSSFQYLSLRDLLDAREAYHVHLTRMRNVIATAVGLYTWTTMHENLAVSPTPVMKAVSADKSLFAA